MQKKAKDLEYYMKLKYRMEILEEEDGGYFMKILDLPGCITFCEDFNQIQETVEDAKRTWFEMRIEGNLEIPEPKGDRDFSGKFLLRLPKSLHRRLSNQAEEEGVSLNQHILNLLSGRSSISQIMKGIKNEIAEMDKHKEDRQYGLVKSHGPFRGLDWVSQDIGGRSGEGWRENILRDVQRVFISFGSSVRDRGQASKLFGGTEFTQLDTEPEALKGKYRQ